MMKLIVEGFKSGARNFLLDNCHPKDFEKFSLKEKKFKVSKKVGVGLGLGEGLLGWGGGGDEVKGNSFQNLKLTLKKSIYSWGT